MSLSNLLDFHLEVNKLKRTVRYESCNESVQDSAAEHSWHLALMVMDVANALKLDVDVLYSTKLALVHDLCEYQGEKDFDSYLVSRGQRTQEDKKAFEQRAMETLRDKFGQTEVYEMWRDYDEGKTPEGRYVRAMDKIEALVHLIEVGGSQRDHSQDGDYVALYADKAVLAFPPVQPFLKTVKDRLKTVYQELGVEWKPEYDVV